ncbi:hypothetical protein PVK06_043028 [Gossypium arboreum]|uniref:Uncharacterized protein n=1 Tax=Gossypium arboreum TaxID=29729 RepID=A0ABR0MPX0_GOSAR|nr:hypothetical protein PVK06_043028 [Gossypium arboreum]
MSSNAPFTEDRKFFGESPRWLMCRSKFGSGHSDQVTIESSKVKKERELEEDKGTKKDLEEESEGKLGKADETSDPDSD